jgi:hypothetical protein
MKAPSSTSVVSSLGLALLGTTCCALPVVLVLLGAGGAVASLVSALPWLAAVSAHKAWLFTGTAALLAYNWRWLGRLGASRQCSLEDARRLTWQRRILWFATITVAVSICVAYLAEPLARRLEQ